MCGAALSGSLVAALALSVRAQPRVPTPDVSAPVTDGGRGQAFGGFTAATTPERYLEEERFFSGRATLFNKVGAWTADGLWRAIPGSTADFTVRMLVRRPGDPRRFNGIVVVEWLNVTAQLEGAADYMQMQGEIVREGYAWVGVGAHAAGVNAPRTGLKAWDPLRYGSLAHPGDAYSYDIFSQAAQALRNPKGENFCFLFGHTRPFDAATLAGLYPTHDAYVTRFNTAVETIVREGYWLRPEADLARKAAEQSRIGVKP
jgi:hypothetical protein